ncbi:AlpA family transcriptional regulator [Glaciecola sp. KUL10]|uniref:AlpA family transcriptional regulator n=1 Tax=Glaciecola sp. (strain KUL10) TaxID=2161813 RepID=UPI000D78ADC3|nr:AlpA family transcriptional regulator [Glaciecola sp. KUL10]GBL03165.1 DNA-binding protein [Glaciecola sp. KUL10]
MRLIRLKEVIYKCGLGKSTIYKYIANDAFPKPLALGDKAVAWLESEIDEWIIDKIKKRQL